MAEAPDSVLNKVYVDADGKPVPAAFGVKLERDTRLTPGEVRTLRYDVPASVSSAEVAVVFRLLPQKLADTLGLADAIEATPKTVVEKVVQRAAGETAPR